MCLSSPSLRRYCFYFIILCLFECLLLRVLFSHTVFLIFLLVVGLTDIYVVFGVGWLVFIFFCFCYYYFFMFFYYWKLSLVIVL